jgi:glycine/D-amino acid oxidase-like deaminating enzyme
MYAVIRRYTGATQLFDELARRRSDVEQILTGVQGFRGYYLVRSGDGGASITVCDDQAGTSESTRRAADWIRQNVPNAASSPPQVTEGEVLYNF